MLRVHFLSATLRLNVDRSRSSLCGHKRRGVWFWGKAWPPDAAHDECDVTKSANMVYLADQSRLVHL